MKITRLRWTPYAIPFRRPLATSHRRWDEREGVTIEIETDAGLVGLGDVAPLPEFGTADVAACLRALDDVAPRLAGVDFTDAVCAFDAACQDGALAPLRCAVESACIDIEARVAGVRVAALLAAEPARAVPVNAIVADEREAASAVGAGYRCLKLKVGSATGAEDLARVVAARRAIGPQVALRLDANGAWDEAEAIAFLEAVARYDIEFIEQPVAAGDLGAMRRVREAVDVPIAADEDVTGVEAARRVIDASAVDVLVVKPAVAGGLRRAMDIVQLARGAGLDAVVTSAMESGVGVAGALHVAAAARPERACGLGTLELLAGDLVSGGLRVVDGAMALLAGPGLGVALDARALARYATALPRMVRA